MKTKLIFIVLLTALSAAGQGRKSLFNPINDFPSYEEVTEHFRTHYSYESGQLVNFSRRPDGWYAAFTEWKDGELQEIRTMKLWALKNRSFLPVQKADLPDAEAIDSEIPISPHLAAAFRIHPYYGYKGWDKDVIKHFAKNKQLPDTLLYGTGRAYSNMAQGFIRPQYDYHYQNYPVAPYGMIPKEQTDSFVYCVNRSIKCFEELAKRNPDFQTLVGNITLKAANEYLYAWLNLKSVKDPRAANYLKERLYDPFFRITARNFLNSCDSSAILFTGGDNDTYPLWYVQEKESFRTDVRVINLSLLNTAWYIDMLREKYAVSDLPLPLSLKPEDYKNRLDFSYVMSSDAPPNERVYQDLPKIIRFIASDNPETKLEVRGQLYPYIPAPHLVLAVDFRKVIRSKTIPAEWADRVEEQMKWHLDQYYITRSQIIVLDLIAHHGWNQPVYWSTGIPEEMMCGLESYTRYDGLVLRLTPLRIRNIPRNMTGFVVSETLSRILNENLAYESLNDPVYRGNTGAQGMVNLYRLAFARLAMQRMEEDKQEDARRMLERCDTYFPADIYPYRNSDLLVIEYFYRSGNVQKGDQIARTTANHWLEEINRLNKTPANRPNVQQLQTDINKAFETLDILIRVLNLCEREELANEIQRQSEKRRH